MVDIQKLGSLLAPNEMLALGKHAIKAIADGAVKHGPEALVVTSLAGFGATVYFAVKEAPIAKERLAKRPVRTNEKGEVVETRLESLVEDAKVVVPCILPALATGTVTVVSIIGGNRIQANELKKAGEQIAALTAAYSVTDKVAKAYQDGVVEKFGPEAHDELKKKAQQKVEEEDCPFDDAYILNERRSKNDVLWYDHETGFCFWATEEEILAAEGKVSKELLTGPVSVCDFYQFLGVRNDTWEAGTIRGWDAFGTRGCHLDVRMYKATMEPDGVIPKRMLQYDVTDIGL